ncbi:MAG: glycosyltransferase family 2 protein [Opitutae bacterium]|nr:glycosyltransferase family 2 protein [Opitutae bacterium]
MKHLTIVSGCYNEASNLPEFLRRVWAVTARFPDFQWNVLLIDNASTDDSEKILRAAAAAEPRLKVIFNARNFGHIRSPYHGILQAPGDAVIFLASDLQDPPELIEQFIPLWEKGAQVVAAVKNESEESPLFFLVRKIYYRLVARLADVDLLRNFTGFGLYDRRLVEYLRASEDPYPYLRGQISEIGLPVTRVPFVQPRRKRGFSKNNFYTLYDIAMLGFTNHTKVPLRLATIAGFTMALFCFGVSLGYLIYKLLNWESFQLGLAPIVVGLFFIGSVQLFFIGVLGEYIGAIHTKVTKRPLVVERERLNF